MPWCGIVRHGWSLGAGCGNQTSPRITGKLIAFEGADDGVTVADFAARSVHEISATLHFGEKLVVEEALGFRMKWRIDRDDVADLDHVLEIGMPNETKFLFDRLGQSMPFEVVQVHVEGLQSA
jgi:hypothetical protein